MEKTGIRQSDKAILACKYIHMMEQVIGNDEAMKTLFDNRSELFDFYDYPEYTVALKNDKQLPMFQGDRLIRANDGSFHLLFRKTDGFTAKWGTSKEDDPAYCPWGNEIADIEITTACNGIRDKDGKREPCAFCYKANTPKGNYMSLKTFKGIFDLINQPRTMTQIAFGIDAECKTNPDVWKIMDYCNKNNVVPNVTVADIDGETAENIVARCGACAVSCYERDKNRCYDSIKLITVTAKRLMKRHFKCNLHLLVSEENADFVKDVLDDRQKDDRLKDMHAMILLSLKQKGRGVKYHKMNEDTRKTVINSLLDHMFAWGSDSCGANQVLKAIKSHPDYEKLKMFIEPCEKYLFSLYINSKGVLYPCSFMEKEGKWKEGIDLVNGNYHDFTKEIWNHKRVVEDREQSLFRIKIRRMQLLPFF